MDSVLPGFIKYPSANPMDAEDWRAQQLAVVLSELPPELFVPLEIKSKQFEQRSDSIFAIEAFCLAHRNGYFPPYWAIKHLAEAFEKYHAAQGIRPLDQFLKLSPKKFKALLQEQRDEMVMTDVAVLISLGLSAAQASMFAARRLSASSWNETKFKTLGNIREATVLDRWKKRWNKTFTPEVVADYFAPKSPEARAEFLKIFPGALKMATANRALKKVVVRKRKNGTT